MRGIHNYHPHHSHRPIFQDGRDPRRPICESVRPADVPAARDAGFGFLGPSRYFRRIVTVPVSNHLVWILKAKLT